MTRVTTSQHVKNRRCVRHSPVRKPTGAHQGRREAVRQAGLAGLTRALAREVGPRGITVNTVQPGPVDTDMSPGEVASLVAYLAGPESAYVTGATLNADGGYSA
ncbi:SDR family oxidoreductase [Dactylosporangium sp. NBC_01737]|uniref:SDR family oxidoreductase n=1 Tax=Dactylosporangium sp. NBC_01737 TaxID=2975959 RepID=UPI002E0EF5A8|nr:SDR family oxidoreductase [Dactylosporangium sp. NBC_01737]